ncbi:hypothetical protein EAE_06580 [Klebsiella aerogenes KCTC 2190]|uniref:Uncharacterized protein n=1 Tax=Klebsiella aerogenes (strain ATCC 13048 / DSM 30053 / CCUG 1429 / JCM 1235 / KCTC 2190 / NBRC 13534 / NCIMB 10102 / NCTC 10006 / CDC 819-56) TaxID=1028307 RepID=A0A0H3FLF2_KLEAK|nr:hypothetical protein EAE_06580 [Klebsiella aerogenes KCTC 2190]
MSRIYYLYIKGKILTVIGRMASDKMLEQRQISQFEML